MIIKTIKTNKYKIKGQKPFKQELYFLVQTQQLVPSVSGRTDRKKKRLITIGRDPDKLILNILELFWIYQNHSEFSRILSNS